MARKWRRSLVLGCLTLAVALPLIAAWLAGWAGPLDWYRSRQEARQFSRVDRMEESYLHLTKTLKSTLNISVENLRLPDHTSLALFADWVEVRDLSPPTQPIPVGDEGILERQWGVGGTQQAVGAEELNLWQPLLAEVDYFERAKFYVHFGGFADEDELRYEAEAGFSALAWLREKRWAQLSGRLDLTFERPSRETQDWRITRWQSRGIDSVENPSLLFTEVLDTTIPLAVEREEARRSRHEELVLDYFLDPEFEAPNEFFTLQAFDRHPGLAVADVDRDGDDDLLVVSRWGQAQLYRQAADGGFYESAAALGIELLGHASSAIFADFDNDGDVDLFVGRTLEASRYYENEDSKFTSRSDDLPEGTLPYLVSSVNAVDYDNDGLLDVYFSTYAATMMHRRYWTHFHHGEQAEVLPEFISSEENAQLNGRLIAEWHDYQNRVGPPNILLRNVGEGRFERVRIPELEIWRNTYQSTWADFDNDGDQDCYVANDFAKNHLLRNEGEGVFVDVTAPTETADIGFGMGAAWGDYDNDGDQDLYVTNMFSKAGQRIIANLPGLDPSFANMARGNTLFRNDPGHFKPVSGLRPPALTVERAGWSWGGQFFDANNDGCLDLYALSGFYTAPDQVAIPVDT